MSEVLFEGDYVRPATPDALPDSLHGHRHVLGQVLRSELAGNQVQVQWGGARVPTVQPRETVQRVQLRPYMLSELARTSPEEFQQLPRAEQDRAVKRLRFERRLHAVLCAVMVIGCGDALILGTSLPTWTWSWQWLAVALLTGTFALIQAHEYRIRARLLHVTHGRSRPLGRAQKSHD